MPTRPATPYAVPVSAALTAAAAVCVLAAMQPPPPVMSRIEGVVAAADAPAMVQVVEIAGHRGRVVVDNPDERDLLGVAVTLHCLPDPYAGGVRCTIADKTDA